MYIKPIIRKIESNTIDLIIDSTFRNFHVRHFMWNNSQDSKLREKLLINDIRGLCVIIKLYKFI